MPQNQSYRGYVLTTRWIQDLYTRWIHNSTNEPTIILWTKLNIQQMDTFCRTWRDDQGPTPRRCNTTTCNSTEWQKIRQNPSMPLDKMEDFSWNGPKDHGKRMHETQMVIKAICIANLSIIARYQFESKIWTCYRISTSRNMACHECACNTWKNMLIELIQMTPRSMAIIMIKLTSINRFSDIVIFA